MKNLLLILAVIPLLYACKCKKDVVKTSSSNQDAFYVMNVVTNKRVKYIQKENSSPDGSWRLQFIDEHHDDEMQRVTLSLNVETKGFEGNDACNSYFGKFSVLDKKNMVFGGISATERACMIPAKHADLYYKKIKQVKTYRATKDYLLLYNEEGKAMLQFKKIEEE